MRLDRFVSQATGLSRSEVKGLIRKGRVRVDGEAVRKAAFALTGDAQVSLAGRLLALPEPAYLMLHKPCGLLSATSDDHQPTVLSLLPEELARRLHLVGRLDKDTSGLLLLTDDGAWSHRVTAPRQHCSKTYRVTLAEPLAGDAEQRLAAGLMLRGEKKATRPAGLRRLSETQAEVTISEGRYHQVRRMFAALGNRVTVLHRERIGTLELDSTLQPGEWRALTPAERDQVFD